MKMRLIGAIAAVVVIFVSLATPVGVLASLLTGSGEPLPPAVQWAWMAVRVLLALAVAAAPGILFWLVVLGIVLIARRVWRSTELTTVRDCTQPKQERHTMR